MVTEDAGTPPPWFEEEEDEEAEPWPEWVRLFVFGFAALVIVVMVLIPVMQAAILQDESPRPTGDSARNAAVVFASSVLERRSVGLAMDVAVDDIEPEVSGIIDDLSEESAATYRNAVVRIFQARCGQEHTGAEQCFAASLVRPGELALFTIEFGVSVIDGEARVVSVTRAGVTV